MIAVNISSMPFTSVRLLSNTTVTNEEPGFWLTINGEKVTEESPMKTGADGIALTPDGKTLVFCPLSSHGLY